jgi:succinate dehydrogenase / fumarate reductase cytochrome b subunit
MNDSRYFVLKKLHSLSGVVPVAGFVIFHLFENSKSVAGADAFNSTVAMLRGMPYLYLLEIGLLAPIVFHALLGIYIARTARHNPIRYGWRANWMYTLQRISGIMLVVFIGAHLWHTRFANVPSDQMFQHMAEGYAVTWIFWGYIIGIAAAAFHLGNGLWGFAFSWGLVTGQKSQDLLWKGCMALSVAVFLMGINAALGFTGKGVDIFQHDKTQAAAPASVPAKHKK